ncbi:unnamed protein product [Thlaspi arvense]|uniref:DNA-directed RNA polymerase III subunit RPC9 n=1 Tax=Thlaspi arvense TaxID=13288 RepID=A0AAU9R6W1_THLAR|nr:unnamed protein product [Thlaspi arvense]
MFSYLLSIRLLNQSIRSMIMLVETAAYTQTQESVNKLSEKCKDFKVAKAESLNIINLRPSSTVELMPVCGFSPLFYLLVINLLHLWCYDAFSFDFTSSMTTLNTLALSDVMNIWLTNKIDEAKDLSCSNFILEVDFDEENKVPVCCDEFKTRAYIVGKDMYKQVYKDTTKGSFLNWPLPSLVHIQRDTKEKEVS